MFKPRRAHIMFFCFFAVGAFIVLSGFEFSPSDKPVFPQNNSLTVNYFYTMTCPYCIKQRPIVEELREEFPHIEFVFHDVSSAESAAVFQSMFEVAGLDRSRRGVPTIFVGTRPFVGLQSKQTIIEAIADCQQNCLSEEPRAAMIFGYCPTMRETAESLVLASGFELMELPNAASALESLRENKIDAVLVGRVAQNGELAFDTNELRLADGFTLVSVSGGVILYSQLSGMEVHVYSGSLEGLELLPLDSIPIIHSSVGEAMLSKGFVLVDWRDYTDEMQLVVVLSENGDKHPGFRAPVLYYRSQDVGTRILEMNIN